MAYVEWLRVRGCLKWAAYVLGALFLVAVVLRIAAVGVEHNLYGQLNQFKADPGSQVSEAVLPDGTRRTTIYDPVKKVRAVIDDRGWNGKHIVLDDWSPTAKQDLTERVGSESLGATFEPDRHGRNERIDVTLSGPTPLAPYLVVGFVVALIVATVLGAPFAREGDGHLEVALTKPIGRELFALQTILIDWCALIAAFFGATLLAIAAHALFDLPHITFDRHDALVLVAGIIGPLAWYAMINAATASLKRGYGVMQGLSWPIAAIVVGLSLVSAQGNPFLTLVHDVAWTLSWIDPLRYMHFGSGEVNASGDAAPLPVEVQVAALSTLAVVYLALAIVQWRRIEA